MAKVETFIKVTMEMDLAEAREVRDILDSAPGGYNQWKALSEALKKVDGVK